MIKRTHLSHLLCSAILITAATAAISQTTVTPTTSMTPASRSEVRMERDEFLKAHRYDENERDWLPQDAPTSNQPRTEVKAARDQFLSANRWDNKQSTFVPIQGTPRDISVMSREEIRMETMEFTRTHTWNNRQAKWELRPMR